MAELLRIVQLNIGSLLEPGWEMRRHEIVAWLRELRPDVACFEEVWEDATTPNTAGWIVDQLPELGFHWAFGGAGVHPGLWPDESLRFGSAVLSRWPIDELVHHRLPILDDDDDPVVRGAPWELVHARTAGLDVFACHLAPAPTHGRHRVAQVLAIDELMRTARGTRDDFARFGTKRTAMPAILCGDFNAEPDSDEIRFLCGLTALGGRTTFLQDAWRVAADGPGHTQDWRVNPTAAALNVHRKRIDYVFVGDGFQREGDAGRVVAAQLAFHESRTGVLASDHAGLVVEVVWPDRPSTPADGRRRAGE